MNNIKKYVSKQYFLRLIIIKLNLNKNVYILCINVNYDNNYKENICADMTEMIIVQ